MSCQAQVTAYYEWMYKLQQAIDQKLGQGLIDRLQAEGRGLERTMLACVRGQPAVQTVFALGGTWSYGDKPGPVVGCQRNLITINMSAYPMLPGQQETKTRATAGGLILDKNDIWVYFPDDNSYTGRLEAPNLIVWSNNSEWVKT